MSDYLIKAYAFDGTVRIYSATTKLLVEEARAIHDLFPTATAALGRLLTASAIMGTMYKKGDELTIRVESDGPINGMLATANSYGHVRGYVGNPKVLIQYESGKLDVGSAVGKGFIHVTKNMKIRDFFTSTSPIQSGEIAEDFAYYFAKSEQIPSAVSFGVKVDTDNSVIHAGGFILQVMPGCKDETLAHIETTIINLPSITEMYDQGETPESIVDKITGGNYKLLDTLPLKYHCDCNRDKFERGLLSLGKKELEDMLDNDDTVETVCHFCQTKYHFDAHAITSLIEQM